MTQQHLLVAPGQQGSAGGPDADEPARFVACGGGAAGPWRALHPAARAVADVDEDVVLAAADATEPVARAINISMLEAPAEASA